MSLSGGCARSFLEPSSDVPDVFFVWCEVLLRLAVWVVLIALVWLVLYRSPGFLVACFYFIVGIQKGCPAGRVRKSKAKAQGSKIDSSERPDSEEGRCGRASTALRCH
jgi:hypothetical protein